MTHRYSVVQSIEHREISECVRGIDRYCICWKVLQECLRWIQHIHHFFLQQSARRQNDSDKVVCGCCEQLVEEVVAIRTRCNKGGVVCVRR